MHRQVRIRFAKRIQRQRRRLVQSLTKAYARMAVKPENFAMRMVPVLIYLVALMETVLLFLDGVFVSREKTNTSTAMLETHVNQRVNVYAKKMNFVPIRTNAQHQVRLQSIFILTLT